MAATSDRTLFEKIEQSEKQEDILDEVIEGSLRITVSYTHLDRFSTAETATNAAKNAPNT